ncbi:MAG: thiamine pyrophosphate-binding protein [Chloroflexota bacterium]
MQSNDPGAARARRRLSGKRALFEQLLADGVTAIFGNPGTTEQGFVDLLPDYPSIQFYLALHEGVAVSMADAYARLSGRPALVELHIAPGLGNALGMLYNAWIGQSPLVVYVGQSPTTGLFQEPHLSGDLVSLARPLSKWAAQIDQAADVPQALRRAFKIAQEPPQGPVVLALPIDVLEAEADVLIEPTTFVRWQSRPAQADVREAAELLLAAQAPAISAGDRVHLAGAQAELVALAELLGAPIIADYANSVVAPAGHPLYQTRPIPINSAVVRRPLVEHDLLLAIGGPLFRSVFPDQLGPLPDALRLIQIDVDSRELGKNVPGGLLIKADPRQTLAALCQELAARATPAQRQNWQERGERLAAAGHARHEREMAEHRRNWDSIPISAPRLMAELAAALPADGVVFEESITSGGSLEQYLQPAEPWRRFRARGGGIGGGMPGALGAKLALPQRPVVGLVSEGASAYSLTALWTAAHHQIGVKYVVCDNRSYRILKQNLRNFRPAEEADRPFVHMDLTEPELRFDRLAEAFGVPARRVERPDDIAAALRWALATDGPTLVDVVLDGSP